MRPQFENTLQFIKTLASKPVVGNRWYKVNLHVHASECDVAELVARARESHIDLLAVTDHQTFEYVAAVRQAASSPGRPIVILPGMEVTTHEGVHLLIVFPPHFSEDQCEQMMGYLELSGTGNTSEASKRTVDEILKKIHEQGGVAVVPHPFSAKTGLFDSARKMSTRIQWLESGYIRLIQASEDKISYVAWNDADEWINRYVLASANKEQIRESDYCLAPLNISDCYLPSNINVGCSWLRMGQASVEGLKQVACEPAGRIRKTGPEEETHNAILAIRISGGYCDGESIEFNSGLNCIVGQNHAGKSAVFDFIRFALATDDLSTPEIRSKLYGRLTAILGVNGQVELVFRYNGFICLARRALTDLREPAKYFRFDEDTAVLAPVPPFRFEVEVYEQGRIQKLRDDVNRQLDMLDEFAGLHGPRQEQDQIIDALTASVSEIRPLKVRQEKLVLELAALPALENELNTKESVLPEDATQRPWSDAEVASNSISSVLAELLAACQSISTKPSADWVEADPVWTLFNQTLPPIDVESLAEPALFRDWITLTTAALLRISEAGASIIDAIRRLKEQSDRMEALWETKRAAYDSELSRKLASAGVESPQELIDRVSELRNLIADLRNIKRPQLEQVTAQLSEKEAARNSLLQRLREIDHRIREARSAKAVELTNTFGGQIEVIHHPCGDRAAYRACLNSLYSRISSREQQIKNIDTQLALIADRLTPLELADALKNKGVIKASDGTEIELAALCGITPHTQSVLCTIANDVSSLNILQTARTPDILEIRVKRQGELVFADLTTELSQGEQSAALLTLTLQSRVVPLILDQPEDELGYNYVVNLIVPKILKAKFSRQMLIATHNANIPVLGDADFVVKMENRPKEGGGRQCRAVQQGCFEDSAITTTLMELEGGKRAFEFRRHRYSLTS